MGIASYAYMAKRLDKSEVSEKYFAKARRYAQWEQMSYAGDHYRIAFGAGFYLEPEIQFSLEQSIDLGIFPDSI